MQFIVIQRNQRIPDAGKNTAYLQIDHWNDYSFVTMFQIVVFDEHGNCHDLGSAKIGFKGQTIEVDTYSTIGSQFEILSENYFSVGLEVRYYQQISGFSEQTKSLFLTGLRDIAYHPDIIDSLLDENVFKTSLLRDLSLSVIRGQFRRVLDGGVPLTDFQFSFRSPARARFAEIELEFGVNADSKPSTNIHAIIGRNGVGKTTILNGMIEAITREEEVLSQFIDLSFYREQRIGNDYFSSLVSVSFSAFDPFNPPEEQSDPTVGPCYSYIGIKGFNAMHEPILKPLTELHEEFVHSIALCMSQDAKRERWLSAISTLESDENFAEMNLRQFSDIQGGNLRGQALSHIQRMSSGHAVVLFTVTRLVATVEEKTLVLIDEPESHLHPPLLSAFTRALSELLHNRNGVAIIATHSPVVLQELPTSCVWKIQRSRLIMAWQRPDIETFGENVGVLTREVFGLEVAKSGFIQLLEQSVTRGQSFEEILASYGDQLGFEGRSILKAMIYNRDKQLDQ